MEEVSKCSVKLKYIVYLTTDTGTIAPNATAVL